MASRKEIEGQIAALQAELDSADTDDELVIEENGRRFHIKGRRATKALNRFKDLWPDDDESGGEGDEDGEDGDEDGDESESDPAPKGGGYFNRRKS
jgi:hypothetical protein